jgi:hypothetical protein
MVLPCLHLIKLCVQFNILKASFMQNAYEIISINYVQTSSNVIGALTKKC